MKKYLILYLSIFTAAFALLLTLCLTGSPKAEEPRAAAESAQAEPEAPEPVLGPDAVIIRRTECLLCGHISERIERGLFDGATRGSLAEANGQWRIASFGRELAVLQRSVSANCPLHPMLMIRRGVIGIYRSDPVTMEPELIMPLDADPMSFPPDERIRLKRGIAFGDYEELQAYLDAYGS